MNKKILIPVIFLICLGLGFAVPFFVLTKDVAVVNPHQGQAIEAVYATGTVEPTILVPIAPRSAAHLVSLGATEGQEVKKGDILAQLENTEQQATIDDLVARLSFAQADLKRKDQLVKTRSISRDQLESARADVDSLAAQVEKAKAQASYYTLIAPADGLILKRDGEVGELIAAAQPIFYMSCCAPKRIRAEVDEEDIPQISVGQDVLIQTDAFPDQIFHGKISSITPKGDSVARSYRVRMSLDDKDAPLMIGMTVETNIIIRKVDQALMIPTTALDNKAGVQMVRGDIIQSAKVQTGIRNVDTVQITSGLALSDSIVVPYNPELKDGQKVRTRPYTESAN